MLLLVTQQGTAGSCLTEAGPQGKLRLYRGLRVLVWIPVVCTLPEALPLVAHKGRADGQVAEASVFFNNIHAKWQIVGFHAIERLAPFAHAFLPLPNSSFLWSTYRTHKRQRNAYCNSSTKNQNSPTGCSTARTCWDNSKVHLMALSHPGAQTRNLRTTDPSQFLLLHIQIISWCLCCLPALPRDHILHVHCWGLAQAMSLLSQVINISLLTGCTVFCLITHSSQNLLKHCKKNTTKKPPSKMQIWSGQMGPMVFVVPYVMPSSTGCGNLTIETYQVSYCFPLF